MRDAMMEAMFELAESNSDVMLLTADLGYGVFEKFAEKFPKQFLNVGVAEQNMIGVASGLALEGKIIFTYSIGNFPSLRCLEQIRNDACYHDLNITIIASGGGFSYGGLGMSHHATEDLSVMRALPAVTVVAPCTAWETKQAILQLAKQPGPGYLRIDKTKVDGVDQNGCYKIGKASVLREGNDFTIIGAGGIAEEAMKAAEVLHESGIECRVIAMHTVKPIDKEVIKAACMETNGIVTIEENNLVGGMGAAVSEVCMDEQIYPKNYLRLGINDIYMAEVGSQSYLRKRVGITSDEIVRFIKSCQ